MYPLRPHNATFRFKSAESRECRMRRLAAAPTRRRIFLGIQANLKASNFRTAGEDVEHLTFPENIRKLMLDSKLRQSVLQFLNASICHIRSVQR